MNKAYLIFSSNTVCSARALELGYTQEEWEDLPGNTREDVISQEVWNCCEVYPEVTDEGLVLVVDIGLVGCDTHIETDFHSEDEWEKLDVKEQNYHVTDALWQAVEAYVVFEPNQKEADRHTAWRP